MEAAQGHPARRPGARSRGQLAVGVVWRVRGARLLYRGGSGSYDYLIPEGAMAWVKAQQKPGRGGLRMGSGRPSKNPAKQGVLATVQTTPKNQRGTDKTTGEIIKEGPTGVSSLGMGSKNGLHEVLFPKGKRTLAAGAAHVSSLIELRDERAGTVLTGKALQLAPLPSSFSGTLPRYPGQSVVSPAFVPQPPVLAPTMAPEVMVSKMVAAYRGAVDRKFPKQRCYVLARGDVRKSKHYKKLLEFAHELIDHDIPPAAWAMFSVERWAKSPAAASPSRPKIPSLAFVFSLTRIDDKHRWQFREAYGDGRIGGRAVFGKHHRELLAKYRGLALRVACTRNEDRAALVQEIFPGDLYEDLVDLAKMEAVENRLRLEDQIKRGAYVW